MTGEILKDIKTLKKNLQVDRNFDVICRDLTIGGRSAALFFVDGFMKDEVFEKVMEFLFKITADELVNIPNMDVFAKSHMPYVEANSESDLSVIETQALSGVAVLMIDGICDALMVDARTYPVRSIKEPEKDRTLRGSRDGFVETLILNTAMVRRRIRDPRLCMEYHQVGSSSKVDVVISYIDGTVDNKIVAKLRDRLKKTTLKGISMTLEALSESLVPSFFFNPFPKIKFTERPDYASACLLEGRILLIMDNCPAVMIFATSFSDFAKETDDYCFPPLTGSFVRIVRLVISLLTVFLTPVFLFFTNNPASIPSFLSFIKITEPSALPMFVQFLVIEFLIDGLRIASLNTPSSISSAMGIVGGLLLSEFAINVGWFSTEAILYMSFVAIANYAQPSFEMGYAMKFSRFLLLVLVQFLGIWGLIGGTFIIVITMAFTKTLSGRGYLYPIIPFNFKDFLKLFVRTKLPFNK